MKCDRKDLLVYAVTDRSWLAGAPLCDQIERAIEGGATFVQLREKDLDEEGFCEEALRVKELCRRYGVPFVINDNVDVALAVDADGIHVGQSDMEAGDVRKKLGADKIIGVSVHNVEQALCAQEQGADYLGVGAVFSTSSKDDAQQVSLEALHSICEAVDIPVVAIGGIGADNVMRLKDSGVCGVAVISAIFAQKDIEGATRELCGLTKSMIEG